MTESSAESVFSNFQSKRFPSGFFEYFVKYKYGTLSERDVHTRKAKKMKVLKQDAFDQLSVGEKEALEAEYFEAVNKKWQQYKTLWGPWRLAFDVPQILERPSIKRYDHSKGSFKLENLPKDIVIKIITPLNSMDFFRMTMVSHSWRAVVHQNREEMKKSIYKSSSYIMDYADCDKDLRVSSDIQRSKECSLVNFGLTYWYCRLSESVETIIFHEAVNDIDVALVLQHCRNLKHLVLDKLSTTVHNENLTAIPGDLHLPKLEVFLCDESWNRLANDFWHKLVINATNLRVLKGSCDYFPEESVYNLNWFSKNVLANLIALELHEPTLEVLDAMLEVDEFSLKYLCLREIDYLAEFGHNVDIQELKQDTKDCLYELLAKMTQLEILVLTQEPEVLHSCLDSITEFKLNLKAAVFKQHEYIGNDTCYDSVSIDSLDKLEKQTLESFKSMLLARDSDNCLSEFVFVIEPERLKVEYEAMNLGFTFVSYANFSKTPEEFSLLTLDDPKVRNYVPLEY